MLSGAMRVADVDMNPDKAEEMASQQRGAGYTSEQDDLKHAGGFVYTLTDLASDEWLRSGDRSVQEIKSAARGAVNLANGVLDKIIQNNGQGAPANADPLTTAMNGGNPPSGAAGAVVTPPLVVCAPGAACIITPPVVSPGSTGYVPSNARFNSGNSDGAKGNVTVGPGATPDANEARAGQGLANLGYDVSHQPTANSQGITDVRTADLSIKGVGQIDVYTPENLDPSNIVKNIEKKASQGDGVLVQADLSSADMASIAARNMEETQRSNLQTRFFQNSNGVIVRFNRPAIGR